MELNEFEKRLKGLSNEELVNSFNKEVGNSGWGTARGTYLAAIHDEFKKREFDYSEIGDSSSLSFKEKIYLKDEKKLTVEDNAKSHR